MININGRVFSGRSVSIINNRVIIDGIEQKTSIFKKNINIEITADIEKLEVDYANKISVKGNIKNIATQSGDVTIEGDVSGSVSTMSGDVNCGNIEGSVSSMSGDIKTHKS